MGFEFRNDFIHVDDTAFVLMALGRGTIRSPSEARSIRHYGP